MEYQQQIFTSSSQMFYIDNDGYVIDKCTAQKIGISMQTKDKILAELDATLTETDELKQQLEQANELLYKHNIISRPKTTEELQAEVDELKQMLVQFMNKKEVDINESIRPTAQQNERNSRTKKTKSCDAEQLELKS